MKKKETFTPLIDPYVCPQVYVSWTRLGATCILNADTGEGTACCLVIINGTLGRGTTLAGASALIAGASVLAGVGVAVRVARVVHAVVVRLNGLILEGANRRIGVSAWIPVRAAAKLLRPHKQTACIRHIGQSKL